MKEVKKFDLYNRLDELNIDELISLQYSNEEELKELSAFSFYMFERIFNVAIPLYILSLAEEEVK